MSIAASSNAPLTTSPISRSARPSAETPNTRDAKPRRPAHHRSKKLSRHFQLRERHDPTPDPFEEPNCLYLGRNDRDNPVFPGAVSRRQFPYDTPLSASTTPVPRNPVFLPGFPLHHAVHHLLDSAHGNLHFCVEDPAKDSARTIARLYRPARAREAVLGHWRSPQHPYPGTCRVPLLAHGSRARLVYRHRCVRRNRKRKD